MKDINYILIYYEFYFDKNIVIKKSYMVKQLKNFFLNDITNIFYMGLNHKSVYVQS